MTDEQTPARGIVDFPESLSEIEQKQIDSLKSKALKEFERLDSKESLSDDEMEHLAALSSQVKAIKAEEALRAEKHAEREAMRAEIRAEMKGDDAEATETEEASEGTDAGTTVESAVQGEATDAAPEGAAETPEAVSEAASDQVIDTIAASVAQRLGKGAQRPAAPTQVRDRASRMEDFAIVASSDTPGVKMGSHLSPDDLTEALMKRARSMGVSKSGKGDKALVASIERVNPVNDIRKIRDDNAIRDAWEAAHSVDNLVASGGWCSPSEVLYDFACDYEAMPETVDLPTMTANRGGVRVPETLKLSDFLGEEGIGMPWTEADDIAAADPEEDPAVIKVCAALPCPGFLPDARLEAMYTCLTAGNLVDRSWPELVNRSRDLALTAHAHRMNARKISKMVAASTALTTTIAASISGTEAVLAALDFQLARFRDAEFTADTFTLEAVAPRWLRHLIRRDLARRAGVEFRQVSNADINAYFAEIGIRIQWVTNWQMLASNAVAYPTSVQILLYPAGAFTLLDGGSLDISVIRDSVLNKTNDHTLLFFEEFWQILSRCASYSLTIPVCATGATGAPAAIACATV